MVVDSPASVGLDDLDRHAGPASGSAANGVGRTNLHDPIGRGRGSMTELASPDGIGIVTALHSLQTARQTGALGNCSARRPSHVPRALNRTWRSPFPNSIPKWCLSKWFSGMVTSMTG